MALGSWTARAAPIAGAFGASTTASASVVLGAAQYTCDGATAQTVDCESVTRDGASDYCRRQADRIVGTRRYSVFRLLRYYICREACEAAAMDCYTVELEGA